MDEGKERMIRFANRMNPLGLGWVPAESWMIRMTERWN